MTGKGGPKVDNEMIYAGLHQLGYNKIKFDRKQKNSQKYKGRIKSRRKKKGRASGRWSLTCVN